MARMLAGVMLVLLATVDATSQEWPPIVGIPGVISPGVIVELVKDGFTFLEGPVGTPDGGLFFSDIRANRIYRMDANGRVDVFRDNSNGANGLALDDSGNVFAAEGRGKRIVRMDQRGNVTTITAAATGGQPFLGPNDLILDRRGGIYVTDTAPRENKEKAFVYYVRLDGHVMLVSDDIARANGLALTLDGKVLLVADSYGDTIFAFDIRADGGAGSKRPFARLQGVPAGALSNADGMALDSEGRVYVICTTGVQVFDAAGNYLGNITIPSRGKTNIAFAGLDKRTLYVTTRERLYRVRMLARGPERPGK